MNTPSLKVSVITAFLLSAMALAAVVQIPIVLACTGITLVSEDDAVIQARTEEWGSFDLESKIMVIPRDTAFTGLTPDGKPGLKWKAKYGVVGINGLNKPALIDGMNEKGLAVSVLYLPGTAEFPPYDPAKAANTIGPQDISNWVLSTQSTIKDIKQNLPKIDVAPVKEKGLGNIVPPIHFMMTDRSGASIVVEYTHGGKLNIYDNPVGVLTNNPEFPWHLQNLKNYVGLTAKAKPDIKIGDLELAPHGAGSGMIGLPGDYSPVSRFVRAAALRNTARPVENGYAAAMESLRILNNFDIPSGAVFARDELPKDDTLGSTQWTTAMDTKDLKYYYKTMFNSRIREIDFASVDFDKPGIRYRDLDLKKQQDLKVVDIK
ncbi:choloylglycine hydrolase family protein [Endozoicomonas sp. 8E]|uniref:choloylglycine hydrolase family protein n=1 Tax=Endozoicomonas sp. 8E TaxID=3035692 RepID=UPI00293949B3|nr:choloylglycine hydrolase family protein [Endozoicomonas sp. 8E]WOG29053.1 choloylglycine hydrolase family protein [Endozoicomonas sp. 8E]